MSLHSVLQDREANDPLGSCSQGNGNGWLHFHNPPGNVYCEQLSPTGNLYIFALSNMKWIMLQ